MSSIARRAAVIAALLVLAGCSDRTTPAEPDPGPGGPMPAPAAAPQDPRERLAYRLAVALRDRDFRAAVHRTLQASPYREGKIHLQRFLGSDRARHRKRLAELAGEAEANLAGDLDGSAPIEIYLPVPGHRREWNGNPNVLVATAERDGDVPVAFDTKGKRFLLDPAVPPKTPVIALGRAELDFDAGPAGAPTEPTGDDSFGSYATGTSSGLWMTYAKLNSTFEGWLKGAPEIEVHMLGQDGGSKIMTTYQCAGEQAGMPYAFNMDEKEWKGNVLLFSQAQLDKYRVEHPSQALRILLLEDDDGPCVIRTDSARITRMFELVISKYGELTGGRDTITAVRTYRRAKTLLAILAAAWSVFKSRDEIIGTAIEDAVAQEYFTGANWIVKGENTATQGAIRLVMR